MTQARQVTGAVMLWAAAQAQLRHNEALRLLHVVQPERGVVLLCLPVARGGYHGCYVAMGRRNKRAEWEAYRRQVTPQELIRYLSL